MLDHSPIIRLFAGDDWQLFFKYTDATGTPLDPSSIAAKINIDGTDYDLTVTTVSEENGTFKATLAKESTSFAGSFRLAIQKSADGLETIVSFPVVSVNPVVDGFTAERRHIIKEQNPITYEYVFLLGETDDETAIEGFDFNAAQNGCGHI